MSTDEVNKRGKVLFAVNGTLMRGLELNGNLLRAGGRFVREAKTDAHYRLWTIDDRHPTMIRSLGGTYFHLSSVLFCKPRRQLVKDGCGQTMTSLSPVHTIGNQIQEAKPPRSCERGYGDS